MSGYCYRFFSIIYRSSSFLMMMTTTMMMMMMKCPISVIRSIASIKFSYVQQRILNVVCMFESLLFWFFEILVQILKPYRSIFSGQILCKIYVNSRQEMFYKKGFLRDFVKYTEKHLCQGLLFKKETLAQVFSCEFCEISKNNFFTEHLRWLLLLTVKLVHVCFWNLKLAKLDFNNLQKGDRSCTLRVFIEEFKC